MSLTLSPIKTGYLGRVKIALADLSAEDLEEVTQDLEAHLAELADGEVETVLGTPEAFVYEFRASAGLDRETSSRLANTRAWVRQRETRLTRSAGWIRAERHWSRVHPAWLWVRGWLGVSLLSVLSNGADSFRAFPIPTIGNSTLLGLVTAMLATWVSLTLARQRKDTFASFLSGTYTAVVALLLLVSLANPTSHPPTQDFEAMPQGLISEGWNPVQNIYAFDTDGNSIQVLLYDHDGRPLLNLPSYVYEEAEIAPLEERHSTDFGQVHFERDELGRMIPNLYPLQTWGYSDYGELVPSRPPSLGFPGSDGSEGGGTEEENVPTTVATSDVN